MEFTMTTHAHCVINLANEDVDLYGDDGQMWSCF